MRRTTVGLVSHRLDAPLRRLTGLGRYLVGLSSALVARDRHDYLLVAPQEPDGAAAPRWCPAPVVRVGGDRRLLAAAWTALARPRLDRLVTDLGLVHVCGAVTRVPAAGPVVYTVHDLFPLERPEWSPRRGSAMFAAVASGVAAATRVVVPSRVVADAVVARLGVPGARVVIVPEGVDDAFRDPPDPAILARHAVERDRYWLVLGGGVPRKNVETAIRALSASRAAGAHPLVVVGPPGPDTPRLQRLVRELRLDGRVRWLGFVADPDVPSLVAGARALVHPALDEGFGLPPLEAMAAGTPVLAAGTGAIPEVVGEAGWLLAPRDVTAWARALDALATDGALRGDLAERGRERAAGYTWDAAAAATEEVYATCLGA